jgi:hypothetical protein
LGLEFGFMKILVDIDSFYRGFSLLLLISTDSIPHVFLLGSEVDFLKIRRKGRICPHGGSARLVRSLLVVRTAET